MKIRILFLLGISLVMSPLVSVAAPACSGIFAEPRTSSEVAVDMLMKGNKERLYSQIKSQNIKTIEFVRAIEQIAKRDPVFAKVLNVIKQKKYSFAMDRSPEVRSRVLGEGFKNIYEAQTSSGVYAPDGRSFVESQYLGVSENKYKTLPAASKPKSMYLYPTKDSGIKIDPTVYAKDANGEKVIGDTWVFDLQKIEKNTLFLVGDTYNRAIISRDLGDPKEFTPDYSQKLPGNDVADFVLPLEFLPSIVPYLYEQVRTENNWRFVNEKSAKYKERFKHEPDEPWGDWIEVRINDYKPSFGDKFFEKFPELKPFEQDMALQPFQNYIEGWYMGALPVSKVKTFIFRSRVPTAQEMQRFHELDIEVVDGREGH